jgi:hypothetical protein
VRSAIRTVLIIGLAFAWRAQPATGQYSWSSFSVSLGFGLGGGVAAGVSYTSADPWFGYQAYDPCWDYPFYDGYSYGCEFGYARYRPYRRYRPYTPVAVGYLYHSPSYRPYGYSNVYYGYDYYAPTYGFYTAFGYEYGFSGYYRRPLYSYPTYGVVQRSPRVRYAQARTSSLYRSSPLYRSGPGYKETPRNSAARRVARGRGASGGPATTRGVYAPPGLDPARRLALGPQAPAKAKGERGRPWAASRPLGPAPRTLPGADQRPG